MRPQGVIRVALRESATRLANEKGGATWREIAIAATLKVDGLQRVGFEQVQRGVAPKLARQTVKNMVYAGELVEIGRDKPAGSTQWHALYAPAPMREAAGHVDTSGRTLATLLAGWTG